ncbi:unnamed protein product [Rhodiola kirilowii]
MDARRHSRLVPDPKVRQVGFFTPPPPFDAIPVPAVPRQSDSDAVISRPVAVPPGRRNLDGDRSLVGSYNPSEPLLGSTASSSKVEDGDEYSDDSTFGWFQRSDSDKFITSSSLPVHGGREMTSGRIQGADNDLHKKPHLCSHQMKETASMPEGPRPTLKESNADCTMTGVTTGAVIEDSPKPSPKLSKEKPTKAERRALQESQRAAKASDKDIPSKEKTTKAERRAMQEAQRAAKAALKGEHNKSAGSALGELTMTKTMKEASHKKDITQPSSTPLSEKKIGDRFSEKERKKDVPPPRMQFDDTSRVEKAKKRAVVKQTETRNRVELFRHLPQYDHGTQLPDLEMRFFQLEPMHPAVYKIGQHYLAGDISGGNARCVAMLQTFKEVIRDYSTPAEKTLLRDLTAKISSYVSFLSECRPLSISMGNAICFLKNRIAILPLNVSEREAKDTLCTDIDRFIYEKILLADKVIVEHAATKINDGDVLLTYGFSCVVEMIMVHAHELGKKIRIVIVDSRPKSEGLLLLRRLVAKGLTCTYTHINAVSYIMHEVTCVFLGAASVLGNGTLYSRVGTACVAMVAHAFRVPVLVCCESYKFHERVQLDSICFNELGDPHDIVKVRGRKDVSYLSNSTDKEKLQLLNLTYDATPSEYITLVITDYGMVPPSSVPVIVREYRRNGVWM